MPPLNLLIKPASGSCDMRCGYCFYADEMARRAVPLRGVMTAETARLLIDRALAFADGQCLFAFQGGEPTLAGLPFFRDFSAYVREHPAAGRLRVHYALQTNGLTLDEAWMDWLRRERVLVGVSLDGPKDLHDSQRLDTQGKGTFQRVTAAIRLLERSGVDYNILTVVHGGNVRRAQRLYRFFTESGFRYQQYIECLDPLGCEPGRQSWSLTPERYAAFLCQLFDAWYQDVAAGRPAHNRYFENLLMMLLGQEPESCNLRGVCGEQWVVEADGSVYPCDFYVLDEWRLGDIRENSFRELAAARQRLGFVESSRQVPEDCARCRWYPLCRNGCRRSRVPGPDGGPGKTYFCAAYRSFLDYAYPRLRRLSQSLRP